MLIGSAGLDFGKHEARNMVIQVLGSAPGSPVEAQVYYDSTLHQFGCYQNSVWVYLGSGGVSLAAANTWTGVQQFGTIGGAVGKFVLAGSTSGSTIINAAAAAGSGTLTMPVGTDTLVGKATVDVLTNKTFDAEGTGNSISNIKNADIKAAAAIARNKLAALTVSRALVSDGSGFDAVAATTATEIGYVNGVTSAIQTQLDAKAAINSQIFTGTPTLPTGTIATTQSVGDSSTKIATTAFVAGEVAVLQTAIKWKPAVRAATTANGTLATAYENGDALDGVTLATGDRILLKDQTAGAENGIYVVAASGAPARATDADTAVEIKSMVVTVQEGTVNLDTAWQLITDTITLGSTALVYTDFIKANVAVATTSIQGKVQLATQAEAQAKTDAAKALTAASVADFSRKYTVLIGDGASTSLAITHGLGTQWVTAQVFDASTNALILVDTVLTSSTVTTFTFATAPASNAYRAIVTG